MLPWPPAGFTTMSKAVEASTVMTFLNQLFTLFDRICEECGVHKLETAGKLWIQIHLHFCVSHHTCLSPILGDCYIAACGVAALDDCGYLSVVDTSGRPCETEDNARRVMEFAKQMMAVSKQVGRLGYG